MSDGKEAPKVFREEPKKKGREEKKDRVPEEKDEKIQALDEGDIQILKTYVCLTVILLLSMRTSNNQFGTLDRVKANILLPSSK